MSVRSFPLKGGLAWAATWPLDSNSHKGAPLPAILTADLPERVPSSAAAYHTQTTNASNLDEDDTDRNPEQHFLSPVHMYEYEDWADDSDDEENAEKVEWDAGITDFALFDDDRRQAEASGSALPPGRWDELLSNQASALQRSVDRSRAAAVSSPRQTAAVSARRNASAWSLLRGKSSEEVPDLIPDNSPDLRDDLETAEQTIPQELHRPAALPRITVTPPEGSSGYRWRHVNSRNSNEDDDDNEDEDEDEDDGLFFSLHPDRPGKKSLSAQSKRVRLQRPGLRQGRTLSGQAHVWKWPSVYIPPVSEDSEGEIHAEREEALADSMDEW